MISRAALTVTVLTVVELSLLGVAVRTVGASLVVIAVLVSALIGLAVARRQLSAVVQGGLAALTGPGGGPGAAWITDRGLLAAAGVLLVLPGFLTSAVGGLMTVPPVRARIAGWIRRRLPASVAVFGPSVPANGRSPYRRDVVDVDVVAEDMPNSARYELN